MTTKPLLVLLAVTLATAAACAQVSQPAPKPTPLTPAPHAELAAEIDALAARALADPDAPVAGFSVAVVLRGDVVVSKGYGFSDHALQTPATAGDIYRIGSVTKQFTAAAIMKLVAAGKVGLDDDITKYVPDYPTRGKTITVRHLLTHTSGVKSYTELAWFHEHSKEPLPRAELVAKFAGEPLAFEPGARWSYSNSGYYLLGLVVEKASGQSYADFLEASVLAPAGLADTGYCPDKQDYPRASHGHAVKDGKPAPADELAMAHPYAAGALCSTVGDLIAWSQALVAHRVVDEAAWKQMITPVTLADGKTFPYGFGLATSELAGHLTIGHGGGINGFVSALAYYPADDLYIAVLVNTESRLADSLGEQIARAVLNVPEPVQKDEPIPPETAAALAGNYVFADFGITVEVFVEDGKVMSRNQGGQQSARLRSQGDGTYVVPEAGATFRFAIVDGKAVSLSISQGGVTVEGVRAP